MIARYLLVALAVFGLGSLLTPTLGPFGASFVAVLAGGLFGFFTSLGKAMFATDDIDVVAHSLKEMPRFAIILNPQSGRALVTRSTMLFKDVLKHGLEDNPELLKEVKEVINEL